MDITLPLLLAVPVGLIINLFVMYVRFENAEEDRQRGSIRIHCQICHDKKVVFKWIPKGRWAAFMPRLGKVQCYACSTQPHPENKVESKPQPVQLSNLDFDRLLANQTDERFFNRGICKRFLAYCDYKGIKYRTHDQFDRERPGKIKTTVFWNKTLNEQERFDDSCYDRLVTEKEGARFVIGQDDVSFKKFIEYCDRRGIRYHKYNKFPENGEPYWCVFWNRPAKEMTGNSTADHVAIAREVYNEAMAKEAARKIPVERNELEWM